MRLAWDVILGQIYLGTSGKRIWPNWDRYRNTGDSQRAPGTGDFWQPNNRCTPVMLGAFYSSRNLKCLCKRSYICAKILHSNNYIANCSAFPTAIFPSSLRKGLPLTASWAELLSLFLDHFLHQARLLFEEKCRVSDVSETICEGLLHDELVSENCITDSYLMKWRNTVIKVLY